MIDAADTWTFCVFERVDDDGAVVDGVIDCRVLGTSGSPDVFSPGVGKVARLPASRVMTGSRRPDGWWALPLSVDRKREECSFLWFAVVDGDAVSSWHCFRVLWMFGCDPGEGFARLEPFPEWQMDTIRVLQGRPSVLPGRRSSRVARYMLIQALSTLDDGDVFQVRSPEQVYRRAARLVASGVFFPLGRGELEVFMSDDGTPSLLQSDHHILGDES